MRHGSLGRKRFYLICYIALHIHAHMHITISLGHRTLEIYMKLSAVEPRHLHRLSAYVPFRATSAEDILCRALGLVGKTVFSREIRGEMLHKKTVFQFFSFVSGNVPEYFRKQN